MPWFLKVPHPVRAYSVNRNDRLLSIIIVIWSAMVSPVSIVMKGVQSSLTFEDPARLIHLVPHFIHIGFTEVPMRCMADFNTSTTW